MAVDAINNVLNKVDQQIGGTLSNLVSGGVSYGHLIGNTLLGLFIIFWAFGIYRGLIQEPIRDGLARIARVALIFYFALAAGHYHQTVVTTAQKTPDEFIAKIASSGALPNAKTILNNATNALGQLWDKEAQTADMQFEEGDYGAALITVILGALMLIFGGLTIAIATGELVIIKLSMMFVLAFGPLFILLLLFKTTESMFDRWLGALIYTVVLQVLIYLAVAVFYGVMYGYLQKASALAGTPAWHQSAELVTMLVLSVCMIFQFFFMPMLAGAMTGGPTTAGMAVGDWARRHVRPLGSRRTSRNRQPGGGRTRPARA
jgi:type IV secretion system protein VirB6